MKKTKLLFIALSLIGLNLCAQDLTCADFKHGQFYIPETKEMAKYTVVKNDSISEIKSERDTTIQKYIIIREKKTQIEWKNGIGNGKPEYEIIEWIDDCTYRLTYDASKAELSKEKKWVNENKGIVVSKTKIENNCLYYTAAMRTSEGQTISQDGVIYKK
ncbi:hypothetical protein BTO04_03510 [Polaribacter sp. SA4-10]|uniref:hypothetical protein n=1 Tax=Polaribacter sp. SA4-10 TaxID=754397 RepID=UPI000B3C72DD|nr:hypothetical protein [Polaribacter sp. SA4-10]ARV05821.1 hypothetical protein BTO04_03510 [Polaribacter sp. SA4-10]